MARGAGRRHVADREAQGAVARRVPAVFSINLAPQSMTDTNFVSYVESCVLKSGLPPQALCFEITEQFASSGNISVAESMQRLEALGCEVALDDFGGHTASFEYLRTMPARRRLCPGIPPGPTALAVGV